MCKFANIINSKCMKNNQQLKNAALDALHGKWGKAVLVTVLFTLVTSAICGYSTYEMMKFMDFMNENSAQNVFALIQNPEFQALAQHNNGASNLTTLLNILIIMPLMVGYANAMRRLLVFNDGEILANTVHLAFHNYWHKVWGILWMNILIVLWSMLLIIPGIIKALSYSMTPYILEENSELTAAEAIHRSRLMMHGHKFDLFWLYLSFLGWFIVCCFTLGIGFLWLQPYMQTTHAAFYEEVKEEYALNGGLD